MRYGDAKQTAGPHRFVLKVDGVTSKAACVRGLDCLPSMPECFIAGTAQCDVWEVRPWSAVSTLAAVYLDGSAVTVFLRRCVLLGMVST